MGDEQETKPTDYASLQVVYEACTIGSAPPLSNVAEGSLFYDAAGLWRFERLPDGTLGWQKIYADD